MGSLEQLLEKRKSRTVRGDFPLKAFYEKISRASLVLEHVQKVGGGNDTRRMKSEAHRQFIISLVTALETYFGDLVVEMVDKEKIDLNKKSVEAITTRRFNLFEVNEIIKNKLTFGDLICDNVNFQKLDFTFSFLGNLFNENFVELLEGNKFQYKGGANKIVTIQLRRGFLKTLSNIFGLRHKFIHEISFSDTPPYDKLKSYRRLVHRLAVCIDVRADRARNVESSKIIRK